VISVLIVDDSPTVRAHVRSLLEEDPDILVIGEAAGGSAAVGACANLRPQVVTMDLIMPFGGGVQAIREIMHEIPTPIVVVSALAEDDSNQTVFEALAAGALMVVRRPPSRRHPDYEERRRDLLDAVKAVAGIALVGRWTTAMPQPQLAPPARPHSLSKLVGIGASTGGPAALREIIQQLAADFAPSIAIVQHMTPGFTAGFAEWLASGSRVPVRLAESGMSVPWKGVVVAPDHAHLAIRHGVISLEPTPARNGHRPSVDELFESMADWNSARCIGVLMTGMGEDGAQGLARLRRAGGRTIIQTEETSVVFGMPGAALRAGAAERALSPAGIAVALAALGEAA